MRLSRTITAPTASRGHVERVATSRAMDIKYSSHEGRTFFRASWEFEVSTAGSSKGSIESVSGVAEAGDDERAVVQFRVDGGGVEGHIGCSLETRSTPGMAATAWRQEIQVAPSSLSLSIVAERLPPVASIGSRPSTRYSSKLRGRLT